MHRPTKFVTKPIDLPVIPFLICYAIAALTIAYAVFMALDRACPPPV